jgi:hypothetical protein
LRLVSLTVSSDIQHRGKSDLSLHSMKELIPENGRFVKFRDELCGTGKMM